jgi:hypothetical protein
VNLVPTTKDRIGFGDGIADDGVKPGLYGRVDLMDDGGLVNLLGMHHRTRKEDGDR